MKAAEKKAIVEQIRQVRSYCAEIDKAQCGMQEQAEKAIEALEDYARGIWIELLPAMTDIELTRMSWFGFDADKPVTEAEENHNTVKIEVTTE